MSMAQSTPEKNYGSPSKEFYENQIFIPKEFHVLSFLTLPLKKSWVFVTYPYRIPFVLNQGRKVWILDAKAQWLISRTFMINSTLEIRIYD